MFVRPAHLGLLFIACALGCAAPDARHERVGKGGRVYGGVFNANETEAIRTLFPLGLTQASAHRIAAQVYEGLVRFDQSDLSIRPSLAEEWSMDASGRVYTFRLRKGVRFHDDPCFPDGRGRELVAADVVHCLTALCTSGPINQLDWLLRDRVLGANGHYAASLLGGTSKGIQGLEEVDDHTVRVTLNAAWPGFLQALAHQGCWIWPRELLTHYGNGVQWHMVGTGPFRQRSFNPGEAIVLERDPAYWGKDEYGDPLPYLDAVRYTFMDDKRKELEAFEKGLLSVVYELPVDRTDVMDEAESMGFRLQSVPGLAVQFYGFNVQVAPFGDIRVRKAFSMAVDREFLVDSVLDGLAVAARGVVPPGFADYPYDSVPGVTYDPDGARRLLADAGFPEGKDLPTVFLQVNNNGFGYVRVAEAVQAMLERNLGARVVSMVLPADQHFARIEMGEAQFWREGWIADHPDPENFLALFHGGTVPKGADEPSYLNSTRFNDPRYDALMGEAQQQQDDAERMRLLAAAERLLLDQAVVLPLYHERVIRLLQPWVRDLPINGMEYRDLRAVWFDPEARPVR